LLAELACWPIASFRCYATIRRLSGAQRTLASRPSGAFMGSRPKYYLSHWETLSTEPPRPASQLGAAAREPDVFTQMPVTRTTKIERLRYMTDLLSRDVKMGPITLTYAAIDQGDTNWIVVLKDVGPDISVLTAREGERTVPSSFPERELTRGWLKASYRELDDKRSKPWEPFHKLTQDAIAPVKPGEVVEYRIAILATAKQFKAGHRICLDITCMDVPTGTGVMINVEYIPYHVCSSKTVTHKIYWDASHRICCCRSYPTLPISVLTSAQRRKSHNDDDPI
jgi:predicted acyl esterase